MPRRCRVCNRKLRSPLWRAAGLGPVCARRLGLVVSRQAAAPQARTSVILTDPGEDQMALFDLPEGAA
jgi:hypothetical protein